MSGTHSPELASHLKAVHVGLLIALEGLGQAREDLRDHVCDDVGTACG